METKDIAKSVSFFLAWWFRPPLVVMVQRVSGVCCCCCCLEHSWTVCFAAACGAAFDFRVAGEDGQAARVRQGGPVPRLTELLMNPAACYRGEATTRMKLLKNVSVG